MEAAAEKAEQAGAAPLQMVDLDAIAHLPEGGGAADLPAAEVLAVILTATDFTPPPPPPAAPAMEEATGRQPIQVKFKTLDEYLIPTANGATDMRMAVRFLRDHGADMVGAYYPTPAKGAQPPSDLYHVKETGLLESSDGLIGARLAKSAARYQADLNDMNRQTAGEAKVMFGYVRTLQSHAAIGKVRAMLDSAHRNISAKGFNLGGYLHVKADAVNSDLRVLGAPNGVIDLENGKLLSRKSAAAKLVSWSMPDPYIRGAGHADADKLTEHLAALDAEWLWQAFGYALGGVPARRAYFLRGKTNGGKSTMLDAIRYALSTPYGSVVPEGGVERSPNGKSGATPELQQFHGPRIMVQNEVNPGRMDWSLMKRLTAGDPFQVRGLYQDYEEPLEPTATMFFSLNNTVPLYLGLEEEALYDRLRFLSYPTPEKLDPTLRERVKGVQQVRQAVLARLVEYHVKTPAPPPEDVPNVKAAREEARSDSIGESGRWLKQNVVLTHNPDDRLSKTVLWGMALAADPGGKDDNVWGRTSTQLTSQLRKLFNLPAAVPTWIPDEKQTHNGWRGIRLATPEERAKNAERQADISSQGAGPTTPLRCAALVFDDKSPERDDRDMAPCREELKGGDCPNAEYHVCPGCGRDAVAGCSCPKDGAGDAAGAAPADAPVQGELIKNGAPPTLHQVLDARITFKVRQERELRFAGGGDALMQLAQAQNIRHGLEGLRAFGPERYLSADNVRAWGGAAYWLEYRIEPWLTTRWSPPWDKVLRAMRDTAEAGFPTEARDMLGAIAPPGALEARP